jgi:hypothetical protein
MVRGMNMNMAMNNEQWKSCNDMIGRILTYLDEDKVRLATKKAVKSEIWDFYNKMENDYDNEESTSSIGNR